jgi:hypothetical protein
LALPFRPWPLTADPRRLFFPAQPPTPDTRHLTPALLRTSLAYLARRVKRQQVRIGSALTGRAGPALGGFRGKAADSLESESLRC